ADDGRFGGHSAARARAVPGAAEVLHPGIAGRERQRVRCVRAYRRLCVAVFVAGIAVSATPADMPRPERILDDFDDVGAWHVAASDDVEASLRRVPGSQGDALCLDFNFGNVSGYAVLRRELPLDYGDNYEFSFGLRADAPVNSLQFKLVDASGQNVWWVN